MHKTKIRLQKIKVFTQGKEFGAQAVRQTKPKSAEAEPRSKNRNWSNIREQTTQGNGWYTCYRQQRQTEGGGHTN